MTLIESDFVKQFEDKFDVKAAAPAPWRLPAPRARGRREAEEQDEVDVIWSGGRQRSGHQGGQT